MRFSKEDERKQFAVVQAMVALGPRRVVSEGILHGSFRVVYVRCLLCRKTYEIRVTAILAGHTSCRCQYGQKYNDSCAITLRTRYGNIVRRCSNPNDAAWHNYGGRGIENRFQSGEHFIRWVLENLPHPDYKGMDIDRRNNEGHYEPGNLRIGNASEKSEQ